MAHFFRAKLRKGSYFGLRLHARNDIACQKLLLDIRGGVSLHANLVARIGVRKNLGQIFKTVFRILFYRLTQRLMESGKLSPDGAKANFVQIRAPNPVDRDLVPSILKF